jgi:serine phosphatase RsbU (regulator of sigma subunit)
MILTKTYLEPKHFYRKIEKIFEELRPGGFGISLLEDLLSRFFVEFSEALNISSAQLLNKNSEELRVVFSKGSQIPKAVWNLFERLEGNDQKGGREFPWIDRSHGSVVAVLPAGEDENLLIGFVGEDPNADAEFNSQWVTAFSSFHYALVQHFRRLELLGTLEQARAIQMSLLPDPPVFADFDIAAMSRPAEMVGGDVFDFQQMKTGTLAITIADAAGHGLPAALQARDVIIGLRMGLEPDGSLSSIVEKLNRIIHRSGLASRFVSLFFLQLNESGELSYINAGHPRPLLLSDLGFQELSTGGMILGPMPDSKYQSGYAFLQQGNALVLFSDGVIEHLSPEGDEFGIGRLKDWMLDWRWRDSKAAVVDLFDRLQRHGDSKGPEDDVTVVMLQRPVHSRN